MLLWERLRQISEDLNLANRDNRFEDATTVPVMAPKPQRSRFDKRCSATTKTGRRCRARINEGSEFCTFHDPNMTPDKRRKNASVGGRSKKNMAHLLDGYLRPLTDESSVGHAMDRLYREVRIGKVTPEMGKVLLDILSRLLESGLAPPANPKRDLKKTKVYRTQQKLDKLLTRAEKIAWRRAVANAPKVIIHPSRGQDMARSASKRQSRVQAAS